jgi:hypothetical protein
MGKNKGVPCHEDIWRSECIAPPFLTSALDGGTESNIHYRKAAQCVLGKFLQFQLQSKHGKYPRVPVITKLLPYLFTDSL